jgi:hypothetical protein
LRLLVVQWDVRLNHRVVLTFCLMSCNSTLPFFLRARSKELTGSEQNLLLAVSSVA